ncbi:hypothetical protein BigBertha_28 [Bacillus phage BigBertha]|uniref:Uncharacterized protein n=1 Tax=Bacillus phage BigBertha TaxID=1406781 RepID=U5PS57_9CAUD|nr:hypothetical protein BigBertha_28 [Bacillus phage BigBertha]AGY46536.1 hypothetical protein BigBertha_28 [Bacillus phage BigBertha]
MFSLFKILNCKHDFHYVSTEMEPDTSSVVYSYLEKIHIYCPKCQRKKTVRSWEWKRIEARQEIDAAYRQNNKGE